MTPLAAKGRGKDGQKPCEYVIVLHNRGHEPIAVQLHVCGALGISLECLAALDMHTASSSAGKIAL